MDYDVVIVGAGPAGSTAAKCLCEKGIKTLIIEKDKLPRDKPCGGGLTKRVLDNFSYVCDDKILECYSYSGIAHSPSLKNRIEVHETEPIIGMVLRKKFDYGLVKIAIEKGAELIDGISVNDIKILDDVAITILDDDRQIKSKIIIGADGVWSLIAKKTGLRSEKIDYAVCVLKEFEVDEKTLDKYFKKSRISHIYTSFQDIQGYGWIFPKKNHLNIGIGEFIFRDEERSNNNLKQVFYDFIDSLKKDNIIPNSLEIDRIEGGSEPINTLKKTYSNRAILIGDAAGFVCPSSGEGIYFSMKSGEIASNIIRESIEKRDFSEKFLSKYQKNWKKEFGKELRFLYKFRKKRKKGINENIYRIADYDKKLGNMIIHLGIGTYDFSKFRWKVLKQIIISSIRYRFRKKN